MISAKEARDIQHNYADQRQVLEERIKKLARAGRYAICVNYEKDKVLYCFIETASEWLKELGYLVQHNQEKNEYVIWWEYENMTQ